MTTVFTIQKVLEMLNSRQHKLVPEESKEEPEVMEMMEEELEVMEMMEEGQVEAPLLTLLEPVTTLHDDEEEEQGSIWVESSWSEPEGSPMSKTPPKTLNCKDCKFTCKLQIQMNRHKNRCEDKTDLSKKWKLKISSSPVVDKPSTASGKRAEECFVRNEDGSINKAKKYINTSPGKGVHCKECGKEFKSQAGKERHFEDIHQSGNFPCPGEKEICGKVFSSRNKMSSHYSRNCNPNNPAGAQAIARRRAKMG